MSFSYDLAAALALLISFCIKLAPAQIICPPPFPPLIPSCSSLSPTLSSPSEKILLPLFPLHSYDHPRKLTLFKQSSLSLLNTDQSLYSFTFTTTSSNEPEHWPASLAFILVTSPQPPTPRSSVLSMELPFMPCNTEYPFPQQWPLQLVCDPLTQQPLQIQSLITTCSLAEQYPNETQVLLTYDADAAALHVQAIHYHGGFKINKTFTLSTNDSGSDSIVRNENTTLSVGYITSGEEASITVTSEGSPPMSSVVLAGIIDDDNDKSNHKKVVVWVIVGVSMMGFLMGLMILVFSITKHRGRPCLVSSRPTGGLGAPPSTPSRAPFSHHDLESSATPMMKANAFQISGTASWLKQPNPR